MLNTFIFIGLVVLGALLINFLLKRLINLLFKGVQKGMEKHVSASAKVNTVRSLLKNSTGVVIFSLSFIFILIKLGVDVGPILTGAGIIGLALSFGAQSLVKDIISGVFIIVENQCNVGDRVKIDNYEGKVVKITLRILVLKDMKGNLIYIPNSQIKTLVKISS